MAEDLTRRLHFGDSGVCLGAAAKLYSQIVQQKEKIIRGGIINDQSPKIAELKILWEQCTSDSKSASTACCETLVALVRDGHTDFSYVLKGLLNVVPTASNPNGVFDALKQLLLLDIQAHVTSTGLYHCHYGLRHPPHPFITALTSRSDSWPILLQHVNKLLTSTDHRYSCHVVKMLQPFLTYVLLSPTLPQHLTTFRMLLSDALLQVQVPTGVSVGADQTQTVADDVCQLILSYLNQIKITCLEELVKIVADFIKMASFVRNHKSDDVTTLKSLSQTALILCQECLTFGHDIWPCLKVFEEMFDCCGLDMVDETLVCSLSWLILQAPMNQLNGLLLIAQKVIDAYEHQTTYDYSLNMIIFPLLRLISTPVYHAIAMKKQERLANQRMASQLLSSINKILEHGKRRPQDKQKSTQPSLDAWLQMIHTCCQLLDTLMNSPDAAHDWLVKLQWNVSSVDTVSAPVMLLVTALFWGQLPSVVIDSLNVLIGIASRDTRWAPGMLPLLLYRLSQEPDLSCTMELLQAIPKMATHKVCMTAVMKALQSLALGDKALSPLVLRLTTQLWKLQDRSFPHLQKLLSQPLRNTLDNEATKETLLAKVASIRDVCMIRPHHGADLLPMLSKFLNDCKHDDEASIAAMALDSLYWLCQAEVVDLRTIWTVLAPQLAEDKRPLVIQNLCKLLGSAPNLLADTQGYEDFCSDIVELLWKHSNHSNACVSSAAFTALANFGEDFFSLDDLPSEITREERAKIDAAKAKKKEVKDKTKRKEEEDDEEEIDPVPAVCYIKLLMNIHKEALRAYQVFLSSILMEEVKHLPRGSFKTAMQKQQQVVSRTKVLDSIPTQLLIRFERVKLPTLKRGLAVGLLCCFEPKREGHREDRPGRRHIVGKGRAYQHIINTLMDEVFVEPADWFARIHLTHAWTSLMQNAFQSAIQSRCAELELQRSTGHLDESRTDFEEKVNTAWLWARDKLTDLLKTAAKSSHSAQSNSVLALASLAVVSTHHFMSLDHDDQTVHTSLQHAGQTHWLVIVVDTLLCILDSGHQPQAKIFTWYQQLSGDVTGTQLTSLRSNAALAVSNLANLLLTTNVQQLHRIMEALISGLPGQPKLHQSHDVQVHYGMALGMVAARLYDASYADYTGTEGEVRMIRVVDALESASFTATANTASYGSLLGLALTLSAMSKESTTHIKTHVASAHHKLVMKLDVEHTDPMYVEALCMCTGCLTAACYQSNIIDSTQALNVAVRMQTLCQENDQNMGLAVSTGVMLHNLGCLNHPAIEPLLKNLFSSWSSTITSQTSTVHQRIAALYGLTGLVTGTRLLMPNEDETQTTSDMHNNKMTVTKLITQMLSDWADPEVQNTAAFLLGFIHLVSAATPLNKTAIPSSYSYLPETSILRACMDQLILASKSGPETVPSDRVEVLLYCLAGKQGRMPPLPPVNWTAVLSPMLRLPYGETVHALCLEVALSRCQRPSSALLCVTTWLSPAIFTSFKESCKAVLYSSLPALIRVVPANKLKPFMEMHLIEPFRGLGVHTQTQCEVIVGSLLDALKIPDPPQGVVLLLRKAVLDIYGLIPASSKMIHGRIVAKLAQCLCHLPGADIDAVTSPLAKNNLIKASFVRSYIVCHGKQSMMWLNPCVDVAMNLADDDQYRSLVWLFLVALSQCNTDPSQHTEPMPRIHWLLELMGHAKNVANGKAQLAPNRPIHKAVEVLLSVFSSAVIAWSGTDLPLLLGLAPSWLPSDHRHSDRSPNTGRVFSTGCFGFQHIVEDISVLLAYSLPELLRREPWSQITDKVLDWLLSMYEMKQEISTQTRTYLKASILSLCHTPSFKKPTCWTRVYKL